MKLRIALVCLAALRAAFICRAAAFWAGDFLASAIMPNPPPFAASAAIIAIPEVDCGSGGISCVVAVYDFGIKKAKSVETSRPAAAARKKKRRAGLPIQHYMPRREGYRRQLPLSSRNAYVP